MKMKISILIIFSLVFFNCKDKIEKKIIPKNESKSTVSLYLEYFNDRKKTDSLMDKILYKGDTLAYRELSMIYGLSGHRSDYIRVSILMANKFKYKQAYYDVYTTLYRLNSYLNGEKEETKESLNGLDKETRLFAFEYLKKAANKGHIKAKKSLLLYDKYGELLLKDK